MLIKKLHFCLLHQHLQQFMLELSNGYCFVARQKRFLIEDDEYFADLVFYNRLLRCFVIIEVKTEKLKHKDLGQLQMYVNYYDRHEKLPEENPTIGILLCANKNGSTTNLMEATIANLYNSLIFNNLHVNACNININDLIY